MTRTLQSRIVARRGAFHLDLALDVAPGEVVALVGPNGGGKSTALRALAGLLPLESGVVRLGDRVLSDPASGTHVHPEDRRCGVVFQDHLLFARMTVLGNVAFGLRARGTSAGDARRTALDWLDALGIADLAGTRAGRLSGGQSQRVAIARALATDPDLLLLDEPFASLDPTTRVRVRTVLREHLTASPRPVVLVTHDAQDSRDLADRVVTVQAGTSADVLGTRPGLPD